MSQVIICVYNKSNVLTDSITATASIEAVVNAVTAMEPSAVRTATLGNILSLHVDADSAATLAFAARVREVLTGESIERVVEAWCGLTGTAPENWRVARVNATGLAVNLNTLGGWSTFNVADTRNKTEIADLKQWILEKAGLMADQRTDSSRAIHAGHLRKAGLNFLGYVCSLSELENSWPVEAFQPGSAWLDPTHLYVCVKFSEKLRSYLRSEVGAPERVKSLITEAVPVMPTKAQAPTRWMDLDTWMADSRAQGINIDLLAMQLRELTAVDGEDFPQHHGILHLAEVVIETDATRTGGFNVWVDGEGYPATGHDGLANGQLLEIDARLNSRLALSDLPTELFQCIYSFSGDDAVKFAREHLQHRAIMVVTQYELIFVDTVGVLTIDRNYALPEDVYQVLLKRYPMLAGGIAASTFTRMYPMLKDYAISTSGPMQEALSFRDSHGNINKSFLLHDWEGITGWLRMLDDAAAVPVEVRTERLLARVADAQLETAKDIAKQTTERVSSALDDLRSRRGELVHSQTLDESPFVPVAKPEPTPQADPQPMVYEAKASSERAISVPVLDAAGNIMYKANFIFDNDLVFGAAVDVGFAAQVANRLGQVGYRGSFVANARIAEVGAIAQELFTEMGLAGNFRFDRS